MTHRLLGKCDGRWPEALPTSLVDKSLLLLARFLVYDCSNGGHRIRLETEIPNHDRRRNINQCVLRTRGDVLVVLGYALSAENGRWEEAKIASLCGVLGLRMRPPDELWVNIDIHGGWVVDGVVLRFLREPVRADAFHCYVRKINEEEGTSVKGTGRPERPLPCVVLREDRLEWVGTESRPYLIRMRTVYFQRAIRSVSYRTTKAI